MAGASVTNADIAAAIKLVEYTQLPNGRTTICTLTLDNGFVVIGESHCADAAGFAKSLGETYAFENAYGKVGPLLGFRLADQLMARRALQMRD